MGVLEHFGKGSMSEYVLLVADQKGASLNMSQLQPFSSSSAGVAPLKPARAKLALKSPVRVGLTALALGWFGDILFYNKLPGISVLLFVISLLVVLFGLGKLEKTQPVLRNLWIIVPLLFFATMVFIRANGTLTFLNIMAVMGLLALLVFFYAAGKIERLTLLDYPLILLITSGRVMADSAPLLADGVNLMRRQRGRYRFIIPLLRGLILALPVLAVFTLLLSSADTVFADYVNKLTGLEFLNHLGDLLWQLTFILMVAWVVCGGLLFGLTRQQNSESGNARTSIPGLLGLHNRMGFVEGATVLFLTDLLFIAFAWIQFTYLFNPDTASKMNYAIYREYIHRGFGELLLATVLTLALILGMRWMARLETRGQTFAFNGLSTLMIGLALVMLYSSFTRMLVWENVEYYINTDTRLYVRSFMVWLALTFGWLGLVLWIKPERFAIGFLVAAIGWLVTVNLLNPDADVAQYNLARYQHNNQDDLATRYLWRLSDDAIPVLVDMLNQTSGSAHENIRQYLSFRLWSMETQTGWQQWPSYHLARQQAYDLLISLQKAGKIDTKLFR
jgi:hypothetical protein